jgi:hypothetical protein
MKKTLAATALAIATAGSAALAGEPVEPVELADEQLDQVTAGTAMGPPPLTLATDGFARFRAHGGDVAAGIVRPRLSTGYMPGNKM